MPSEIVASRLLPLADAWCAILQRMHLTIKHMRVRSDAHLNCSPERKELQMQHAIHTDAKANDVEFAFREIFLAKKKMSDYLGLNRKAVFRRTFTWKATTADDADLAVEVVSAWFGGRMQKGCVFAISIAEDFEDGKSLVESWTPTYTSLMGSDVSAGLAKNGTRVLAQELESQGFRTAVERVRS